MKKFFESCEKAINDLKCALKDAQDDKFKLPLIVKISEISKIEVIVEGISLLDVVSSYGRIAHYLNLLCLELQQQRNPLFQQNVEIFHFLNIHPVRLCCQPTCSEAFLEQVLNALHRHLMLQRDQFINGWEVATRRNIQYLECSTSGLNWLLFCSIHNLTPEQIAQHPNLKLSVKDLEKERFKQIKAQITKDVFFTASGFQEMAEAYAAKHQRQIKSSQKKMTAFAPASTLTTTQSAAIQQLQDTLYAKYAGIQAQLETNIPKELQNFFAEAESRHRNINATFESLAVLSSPYSVANENFFCENFLLTRQLLEPFHRIEQFLSANSHLEAQTNAIATWLELIHTHYLAESLQALTSKAYFTTVIDYCELFIDICNFLVRTGDHIAKTKLYTIIQLIQPYLFKASLESGHYEKALYWLEYFAKITTEYNSNHIALIFYPINLQICRAKFEHRLGNFEVAANILLQIDSTKVISCFTSAGKAKDLHPFIKVLATLFKQFFLIADHIAIDIATHANYDVAIKLCEVSNALFTLKSLESIVAKIKKSNTAFQNAVVDWNEITAIYPSLATQYPPKLRNWLVVRQSLAKLGNIAVLHQAPSQITSLRDTKIDPQFIRYRSLKNYLISTELSMDEATYYDITERLTRFMQEQSDPLIRTLSIKLLVKVYIHYATELWSASGFEAACDLLQKAVDIAKEITDEQSAVYREYTTWIAESRNLFATYLTTVQYAIIRAQLDKIQNDLPRAKSTHFYYFQCNDHQRLRDVLNKTNDLTTQVYAYVAWETSIGQQLKKLYYDLAVFMLNLSYELFTQYTLKQKNSTESAITLEYVYRCLSNLQTVCKKCKLKLTAEVNLIALIIEALRAQENKDLPLALTQISAAAHNATNAANPLHVVDIYYCKIALLAHINADDLHIQQGLILNKVLPVLQKILNDKVYKRFRNDVCHSIINYHYANPGRTLLDLKDYNAMEYVELRPAFTTRLKIVRYIRETLYDKKQPDNLFEERCKTVLENCENDLEDIDDLFESLVRPKLFQDEKQLILACRNTIATLNTNQPFELGSALHQAVETYVAMQQYQKMICPVAELENEFAKLLERYSEITQLIHSAIIAYLPKNIPNLSESLENIFAAIQNANKLVSSTISGNLLPILEALIKLYPENPQLRLTAAKAYCAVTATKDSNPKLTEHLEKAVELHCVNARYLSISILYKGHYGVEENVAKAQRFARKLIENGNLSAEEIDHIKMEFDLDLYIPEQIY